MHTPVTRQDSGAWIFQVWTAFGLSFGMTLLGIYLLPVDFWIKGYLGMGIIFTVGSTLSLAKTLRDRFEEEKITNRVASAKTEKILHDYEFKDSLRGV
jgi:hypothetical protein